MKPLVFLDLDGVLVDLEKGLRNFNFTFPKVRTDENQKIIEAMWDHTDTMDSFWYDLAPMEHFYTLYDKILEKCPTPIILSATPLHFGFDERHDKCKEQKIAWVHRHLGPEQALRSIITKSNLKHTFIDKLPASKHVLVDDHQSNISRWNKAGGTGILYNDISKVLSKLDKL